MNCLNVDFKIDGIEKAAGEFSDNLLEHLFEDPENKILVDQTYRARTFLKFLNEVYKLHKNDYGKKSEVDMTVKFVNHPKIGVMFLVKIGDYTYGLCPTRPVKE